MSSQIETLFTTALDLQAPWEVINVELNTGKRRIDFEVGRGGKRATCPACVAEHRLIMTVSAAVGVSWASSSSRCQGLPLSRELPVCQAATQMRVASKRLWRLIRYCVELARAQDDMSGVRHIGVDETSVKRGHEYINSHPFSAIQGGPR